MKKKVLFVIPSLWSGGAEKSLVTLLSLFDYEKYDVDLLTFRKDGLFADKIPEEVNLISGTERYEMFDGNFKNSMKYFLKKADVFSILRRIKYTLILSKPDDYERDKKIWKIIKKQLPKIDKKYDCAIAYTENFACEYIKYEVEADKKICYVHIDVNIYEHDTDSLKNRLCTADKVVTVSEKCRESLVEEFPDMADKFTVIENITSKKVVRTDSVSEPVYPTKAPEETVILTVSRLVPVKNIELAVSTCAELKKRGKKIKWYHIGVGNLRDQLIRQISELGIENEFILLGERKNPYPYMEQCDIYVHPSTLEGKSIAIEEVKCLGKPIVIAECSTASSQIDNGKTGFICKRSEQDMADKIEMLIENKDIRESFSENLEKYYRDNEGEINKLYELIESGKE